jgi:4-hydroxy-tetrahydrodipicolinate reductase
MSDIRIAIVGYGKMGEAVYTSARNSGVEITTIIDPFLDGCQRGISNEVLAGTDVCIEFTSPLAVVSNIRALAACGCNIVTGTTGWQSRMEEVTDIVHTAGIGLVHASNFSLGVHLFRRIVHLASRLLAPYPQYDVAIEETHHRHKVDAPSGTAITLARDVLDAYPGKRFIAEGPPTSAPAADQLYITSVRVGHVPGIHKVLFDGPSDTIELTHSARGRAGLAEGAILAARWVCGRQGVFTMEDVLDDLVNT